MKILDEIWNIPGELIAIEEGKTQLSYDALRREIARLSDTLSAEGLGPGKAISVDFPRSIDCIVHWLAAWKVGAAFIAIEPNLPQARKEAYREFGVLHAAKNAPLRSHIGKHSYELPTELRTVFHSSGSTGLPKTILMPGQGLWPVIKEQIRVFGIKSVSRVYWMLSPGFDASLSDVLTALCSGATLCIGSTFRDVVSFVQELEEKKITHADIAPSLLSRLKFSDLPDTLACIVVGGELCPSSTIGTFAAKIRLVNCYGPTETTICSSMKIFDEHDDPRNIGAPNPGFEYRIENKELWISGPGVALGYANHESESFLYDHGRRWFKSGDLVVERDGEFYFQGRLDRQFKINGQLVNPEEIEVYFRSQDGVIDIRVEKRGGHLVGFCKLEEHIDHIALSRLHEACEETLPPWMVPRLVSVDDIARNENDKLSVDGASFQEQHCVIQDTMSEILGYHLQDDDNFWKVGGDSLLAFDLVQALANRGTFISVEDLRRAPTPSALRLHRSPCFYRKKKEVNTHTISFLSTLPSLRVYNKSKYKCAEEPKSDKDVAPVLLTGATGFLGREVLRILVELGHDVVCIVRAEDDAKAIERIFIDEKMDTNPQVEVRAGDLGVPRWGLSKEDFDSLSRRCGTLIHLAADLNLSSPYSPDVVFSIFETLTLFLDGGREKHLVFASTLSVFASTDFEEGEVKRFTKEGSFLGEEGKIYGGYAAEKTLAENIVVARYPDAAILRFGLLSGHSKTGYFHKKNTLTSVIRTIAILKSAPYSSDSHRWAFDLTPVDYAAQACVALMNASGIFHIANAQSTSLDALVDVIENHLKEPILRVPPGEFMEQLDRGEGEDIGLARLGFSRCNGKGAYDLLRSADLFLATSFDFDGKKTETLLSKMKCKRAVDNPALLKVYVGWSLDEPRRREKR